MPLAVWSTRPKTKAGTCGVACTVTAHRRECSGQISILPLLSLFLSTPLNTLALCTREQGKGVFLLRIQKYPHFFMGKVQALQG